MKLQVTIWAILLSLTGGLFGQEAISIINFSGVYPNDITDYEVEVSYTLTEVKDLFLEIQDSNGYIGGERISSVQPGSGTMTLTGRFDAPLASGQTYKAIASIRTVGGNWETNSETDMRTFTIEGGNTNGSLTEVYVSTEGDDDNAGTLEAPVKTIQKGADLLADGGTCYIRGGVYRETVTVPSSNLTFTNYNGEYVEVSGADLVTGWTQHEGDIYKATFTNVQPQFTQVFWDGKYQKIARYPDLPSENRLNIWKGYADCFVKAEGQVEFDQTLPGGEDHWKDGYFRGINGLTWWNPMGKITASSGKNLTCEMISKTWQDNVEKSIGNGVGFILHLNALSMPGEWYYQDNTVYFWKPGGGAPSDTEVEAQRREWAFVLDGKSGITIQNLHFKATSVHMSGSNNCNVEGCSFRYQKGFYTRSGYAASYTQHGGLYVKGSNNTFNECYFYGSWGNLMNFDDGSSDNRITNSIFKNNGWISQFTSCIQNASSNLWVEGNTFGSTGRFHIRTDREVRIDILHNDFSDCMKVGQDAGSVQITNGGDGANTFDMKGAEIAYNTFHDMSTISSFFSTKNYVVALYLEGAANYTAHHNLCYNVRTQHGQGAFIYLGPRDCVINDCKYYNNTAWDVDKMIGVWNRTPEQSGIENMEYTNNIFYSSAVIDFGTPSLESGVTMTTNLKSTDNNLFTDVSQNDFTLKNGSEAIDYGTEITGITDGFTGSAPDAGCYEYGKEIWTCGAAMEIPTFPEEADDATSAVSVISGSGGGVFTEGEVITITADEIEGKEFVAWTGDVTHLADANSATTTLTVPEEDIVITATYKIKAYNLTVTSGSGSGTYTAGTEVNISSDLLQGKEFVEWTGDISYLTDAAASATNLIMPSNDVSVTATYKDSVKYSLTVISGSGSGLYTEGAVVTITADVLQGKEFVEWTGDITNIADANEDTTSITIPKQDLTVSASYRDSVTHAAINEQNGNSFRIYPNPNTGNTLYIEIEGRGEAADWVSIYSSTGAMILQKKVAADGPSEIKLEALEPGVYVVKNDEEARKLLIQ